MGSKCPYCGHRRTNSLPHALNCPLTRNEGPSATNVRWLRDLTLLPKRPTEPKTKQEET